MRTDYVHALQPLLDRFGNNTSLTLILFTLDESAYGRELAPWQGITPVSASARRGGSSTARKACCASAS